MKLEVGMYVRTKNKGICKIEGFVSTLTDDYIENEKGSLIPKDEITKVSHNIIDLIEVGDYVNGMKITNKFIDEETGNIELEFNNGSGYLYPKSWNYEARSEEYKIKSIVTKEQFEAMQYEIK